VLTRGAGAWTSRTREAGGGWIVVVLTIRGEGGGGGHAGYRVKGALQLLMNRYG